MSDDDEETNGFDHDTLGRVAGVAVIDVVGMLLLAGLVTKVSGMRLSASIPLSILAGQLSHQYLRVETAFNRAPIPSGDAEDGDSDEDC